MSVHLAFTAVFFLFCLAVIYGAICDVRTFTIPNRVSYGLVILFGIFACLSWLYTPTLPHIGFQVPPILMNVVYGLAVFIFFVVFWKLRWVGGGDVKFISAISLFMGLEHILYFVILLSLLSVAFLMMLKIALFWNPYFQGGNWPEFVKRMLRKMEQNAIPYGLPAAVAALIVMPSILAKAYSG